MASALMVMGVAYVVSVLVNRLLKPDDVGYYSVAWTMSGMYCRVHFAGDGAGFLHALTAVANNKCGMQPAG